VHPEEPITPTSITRRAGEGNRGSTLFSMTDQKAAQRALCRRVGAQFMAAAATDKLGFGRDVGRGEYPIHGLRHEPEEGTCGWFVWAGEGGPPEEPNYFTPLHVRHLRDLLPEVEPYLGHAPGWRFLIAPGYEDVWFDESLLDV
jgi:hypothetical protein